MIRRMVLPGLLLTCFAAVGCVKPQPAASAKPPEKVIVAFPVQMPITDYEEFPGRVDAVNTVKVMSRVQGYLTEVDFVDGQEVNEGDVLAVVQPEPYDYQYKAALASVALNEALVKIARITLTRDQNSIVATSPIQIDQDVAQVDQAEANLKLAKANLETAKLNLEWTKVRAPISGRLSRRMVDPGNIVVGDSFAGPSATVITTVVSLDPMYVYFDIDERTMLRLERIAKEKKIPVPWNTAPSERTRNRPVVAISPPGILDQLPSASSPGILDRRPGVASTGLLTGGPFPRKLGMPVAIGLSDEPGDEFRHEGIINFADNVVNRQTGTLRVRGEFDNPDRMLKSGMYCRVRVPVGAAHSSILVEERALNTDQSRKFLYVLDSENKVSQRDVMIGALHNGLRVIEPWDEKKNTGIKLDERVVIEGLQRVKTGGEVDPILKTMTPIKTAARDVPLASPSPQK